eukprot:COSAG06_NODE_4989_length_3804_cov_1.462078_4_plen_98_part_00
MLVLVVLVVLVVQVVLVVLVVLVLVVLVVLVLLVLLLLVVLLLLTHLRVLVNLSLDSIGSRLVLICLHGFDQFHSCHFQGDRLVLVLEMLEDRRDHT